MESLIPRAAVIAIVIAAMCAPAHADKPAPPWLSRINMYRGMEELPALANDSALSEGAQGHAVYLIKNFSRGVRDGSASSADIGSESSKKPFYTPGGHRVAPHSEVAFDSGEHQSQDASIDKWMQGPYHRMLLLNPALQRIGYGYYCEDGLCAQVLDIEDGIARDPVEPDKEVAIEFPPANSTLSLSDLRHEEPSPLESCPGYAFPVGLPITFEVGSFAGAKLVSYSIVKKDDASAKPIEACGYDAYTYRNELRSRMSAVVGTLKAFSGVVVIPRRPLEPGTYRATIVVNDREYSWPFTIAPSDERAASR
ncbi:MAG TPA: CAP domain-containing protein [Candidatus Binataceae bacterium]|nr:CAP domain-containing protein [Candidatus Binataceae bacterium]